MKTQSLVRAGKTSEKTLPGDWERNTSPLWPPNLLPPGDHLHCREPHSFPREDLGNIGHIEKLEFRIMTQVTEELECFSITRTLTSPDDKLEGWVN